MSNRIFYFSLLFTTLSIMLLSNCKKKEDDADTTPAPTTTTVTDIDGNVYQTVTIGTQVWMKENLRVTHYRNGDPITNVTENTVWSSLATEAFCWFDNDFATNGQLYGALYNWYAVSDTRNICPTGWHVPTDAEWTTLENYVGGATIAGGKLKEAGTTHWTSPNTDATNEKGFTALPGGYRKTDGSYNVITYNGLWWTSTQDNLYNAKYRWFFYNLASSLSVSNNKKAGNSLRLIKD